MPEESFTQVITDDLEALLGALPPHIAEPLYERSDRHELLEVVMDLGRAPEARFPHQEVVLSPREVTREDIEYMVTRLSAFSGDNRAGIERTLHRISAIRNREGRIVGLTCRVGRAVFGTIRIIQDLVESGRSLLLLGRPGVGKTTMLREVARVLADDMKKRVVIVDTSNEIAGDGDIPHPAIGHARRMQVSEPAHQHAVMIEAVENHMPEVIVIDEIGTELEAAAARTIAERGVQLVATAHGNTLENLIMNPTLSDLVGGIQAVILGDEEARRRGTQKTVLERKAPPTFPTVVEIQNWEKVAVHADVAALVDATLRGQTVPAEVRWVDKEGKIQREQSPSLLSPVQHRKEPAFSQGKPKRIYSYGINRSRLEQAARTLGVPVEVVDDLGQADLLLTSRNYYRRKPQRVRTAEDTGKPVFVIKGNTPGQIQQGLLTIYGSGPAQGEVGPALVEAQEAISQVLEHNGSVELSPQKAYIRRLQHLMAERHKLDSGSAGEEPFRRVRIFRPD
ncbi:MAG: AAA family ATPase [Chloroflexi bacterium]|nr:AAA family ATPase [Chloroflexota bacterium]